MLTESDRQEVQVQESAPVITVKDLSVRYRLPKERVSSFKEFAIRWLQRRVSYRDLWALKGINFQVQPGEILGVIGRNGAGKSTLLKVLARVLHPTRGRVVVQGQVAPLLELGAGFHPELTGRENVHLYASLLGYDQAQVEARFVDIVDFAGLSEFIDSPLRVYSSGMVSRLGFAVATADYADVFLIDEVLAVGDAEFQDKCMERLREYRREGATAVLVSHDPGTIERMCDRALWLQAGIAQQLGAVDWVLDRYQATQHMADGS